MTQPRSIKEPDDIRAKKNTTGTTILARTVVKLHTAKDEMRLPAATTDHLYGVALYDIPDGAWGDFQIRGRALCRAAGALATLGIRLMSNVTGQVVAWAAAAGTNAQVVGTLETTAGAANDLVEVELAGPGAIAQG